MVKKYVFFLSVFVLLFSNFNIFVFSVNLEVSIQEDTQITKLPQDNRYSLQSIGELTIYNPSNTNKVYEFIIPFKLDDFVGIDKIDYSEKIPILNSTNHTIGYNYINSSKFNFEFNKIKGYLIEPNQTIRTGYKIYGIMDYNLYDVLENNQSVLDYYITSYDFVSNINIGLEKIERDGYVYNSSDGSLLESPLDNTSIRYIVAKLTNPTDYNYFVNEFKVYRTLSSDPYFEKGIIVDVVNNVSIEPFSLNEFDIVDETSPDNSVYWASYDISINYDFSEKVSRDFRVKKIEDQNQGGGGSGGSSGGGSSGAYVPDYFKEDYDLIIKKEASKTLVTHGEEFEVTIRIVNPNEFVFKNISLLDEIPQGFEIKKVSDKVEIENRKLIFDIDEIEQYETISISYVLVSKEDIKGVSYLKPSMVTYLDEEFYSQGVLIINDLIPNEKVFVQKEVEYLDNQFAQVKIIVKNLGNYELKDLILKENIDDDSTIKDISKIFFEKGEWNIQSLNPGEQWEVSYVVSRDANLESIPNVFGLDKLEVFGTLIFSEEIITSFSEENRTIEKIGLGLAVVILGLYLLF
ncbi:MAG: hypothetical protein ACOC16_01570 [Nanoarchaeota archaeon]